jgi:hypothetical protein
MRASISPFAEMASGMLQEWMERKGRLSSHSDGWIMERESKSFSHLYKSELPSPSLDPSTRDYEHDVAGFTPNHTDFLFFFCHEKQEEEG